MSDASPSPPLSSPLPIDFADVTLALGAPARRVTILDRLSLTTLAPGETVAVTGPSGSGKTTLLMAIAGLEAVESGRAHACGCDLRALDEDGLARLRRAHMGIVFQTFHLLLTLTALGNVAIPLELARRHGARRGDVARRRVGGTPAPLSRPVVGG